MSMYNLPADVLHQILEDSPDLATLCAAIRVSRKHHEVFQTHPKSIIRAVITNVVGAALLPALRLAEYLHQCSQENVDTEGLPDESHLAALDLTNSGHLLSILKRNAHTVHVLRDFYSLRKKDRSSPKSMLSQEETLRFDRAMYRYWLWLEMSDQGTIWKETAKSTGSDDEDDDDNDDDEPEPVLCDSFLRLLSSLPSVELCEILDVGAFAEDTSLWSGKRSTAVSFVANADPAALAISLENGGFDAETMVYRNWEPVRRCIKDVLQSRQVEFDELDDKTPSAIVTAPVGAEDKCSRCESVGGLSLLGVNNMILLSGLLPVHERTWLLPGVLHRNREERKLITAHLSDTQNPISEKDIFREMVELDIASTVFDTYSEEHWSTDEWYCLACIKDLYRQRFLPWWRKTKESAHGATAQEDCWYGYNCRTMTHKNAHALKLNHLCKPTRGDQTSLDPAVVNAVLM